MRPSVIVFDVNETLSDLSPLGARFLEVGASASAASYWFASVLRDGFALTAMGENPTFAGVARELLLCQLSEATINRSVDEAAQHVMDGLSSLEVHADVTPGVHELTEDGFRLVTLSNGATSLAERVLAAAHLEENFERLLSVQDAGAWKPSATAYRYAVEQCGVEPSEMVMVAVHPWDIGGAARAGLQTAWVNRSGGPFPATFEPPTYTVTGIDELPELWRTTPRT
jgi:2-haloacid dehalogenase